MIDTIFFMMGEFEASFPTDRHYAKNHMWAKVDVEAAESADGETRVIRFGFSDYAVRLLQDVYFLDWTIEPGMSLRARQEIGAIESKKAESDLFAPLCGEVTRINERLLSDPSYINVDNYRQGWLFEMRAPPQELLTAREYVDHLADVWEVTQRTIKGQLN